MRSMPIPDHPLGWATPTWAGNNSESPWAIHARRTVRKRWNGATPATEKTPPYRTLCALRTGGGGGSEAQRRYWARCMVWSVPIYEIMQRVVDGTATIDDINNARVYCNKVSGDGKYPRE